MLEVLKCMHKCTYAERQPRGSRNPTAQQQPVALELQSWRARRSLIDESCLSHAGTTIINCIHHHFGHANHAKSRGPKPSTLLAGQSLC